MKRAKKVAFLTLSVVSIVGCHRRNAAVAINGYPLVENSVVEWRSKSAFQVTFHQGFSPCGKNSNLQSKPNSKGVQIAKCNPDNALPGRPYLYDIDVSRTLSGEGGGKGGGRSCEGCAIEPNPSTKGARLTNEPHAEESPIKTVYLECSKDGKIFPSNTNVSFDGPGEIKWEQTNVNGWTLTWDNGSSACSQSASINQTNNSCIITGTQGLYPYTISSNSCINVPGTTPWTGKGTVTISKPN